MSDKNNRETVRKKAKKQAAWNTTKRVAPFVWPAGDFDLRARVVLAMLALVGSKFIAILAPILQARVVDDLAEAGVSDFVLARWASTIAYGIARIATNGFQQLRDALWAKVAQRALRRLALENL